MDLKRRLDLRKVLGIVYVVVFVVYLIVGLQPVGAAQYAIATQIQIPSIDLISDVTELTMNGNKLDTPDTIVGSYSRNDNKTLLIGHSGAVFEELHNVKVGDTIIYSGQEYIIKNVETLAKSRINMGVLLAPADIDTLVIMTCAGDMLPNQDATHRLIVTAEIY